LEHIEAIEKRLWRAADTLRANSNYASNEYFMPVMGLIFLRHAYSRFLAVKDQITASLPSRGGKTKELTKADFSQKSAIFLRPEAQFDYLVSLPDSADRAKTLITAMESIEADYDSLRGELPKAEYQDLDNKALGDLLRTLNPEELKRVGGDVFGRIYEYFLTQFANQKAHDGGEFFTPVSLVQTIVNVIEPERGKILDPACGSGGMFVQSAHLVETHHQNPSEALTFFGAEKNPTTIRLAKMNLAVHGLEGNIQKAITYYEDPHELLGKADFVMANPPFNVDEVDAENVKTDPRLPFGLPGVNKNKKVSNGNYLWISYFYSYLNPTGRAGFVMSSQASSAGRDEAAVRRKLVETGHVDIMIAIRSNFFYTRTVPCELWFLDKGKPEEKRDQVLMIDARNLYRKVTRKIYDFSPEQLQNLSSIVWLYRGQGERFLTLVREHLARSLAEAKACFEAEGDNGETVHPIAEFKLALAGLIDKLKPFIGTLPAGAAHAETWREFLEQGALFVKDTDAFQKAVGEKTTGWEKSGQDIEALKTSSEGLQPLADTSRDLVKDADHLYKLAARVIDLCEKELKAAESELWIGRDVTKARKALDEARKEAVAQMKRVRYFHRQAHWLLGVIAETLPNRTVRKKPFSISLLRKRTDIVGESDFQRSAAPSFRTFPRGKGLRRPTSP
jgi:type I restriction enzyme M protein